MKLFRVVLIASLFLCSLSLGATAGVLEDLGRDFAPASGVVVLATDGDYLVDLDASKGLVAGDLLTVLKTGTKIVHPVSGEVLGTLDQVQGVLQVTQLSSGYSHARPVGAVKGVERGDAVSRYSQLPAAFWDYTGRGGPFFVKLQAALPDLKWQDYAASQAARPPGPVAYPAAPPLVFILTDSGLEVRGPTFELIRAYPLPESLTATAPAVPSLRLEGADQSAAGARYGVSFPGYRNLGELPGVTMMADFFQDGERLLLAETDGHSIRIFAVGDALTLISEGDTTYKAQMLALHWWTPAPGAPPYLAVTAYNGQRLASALFAFEINSLRLVDENIPWILGAFDRNGDGSPELLLGQSFDRETFFGNRVRALSLVEGDLQDGDPGFKVPRRFTVQGSLLADLTGDERPETSFVRNGFLYVYDGDDQIYKSPRLMGGTHSIVSYENNPGALDSFTDHASFEVPPLAKDLDSDGVVELIAVASERSSMSAPGIGPGVQKSWLAVFKFRDGMFVKGSLGEEVEVPLQGFAIVGARALVIASDPPSFLGPGGKSHLLAFPLNP